MWVQALNVIAKEIAHHQAAQQKPDHRIEHNKVIRSRGSSTLCPDFPPVHPRLETEGD